MRKSWYAFLFQLPRVPEIALTFRSGERMVARLRRSAAPGTFDEARLAPYRKAWSQPGAATGMINWYRAIARFTPHAPDGPRVHVPTLVSWGEIDAFLCVEMADESVAMCDHGSLIRFPTATHWVTHEEPERVLREILGFLSAPAV